MKKILIGLGILLVVGVGVVLLTQSFVRGRSNGQPPSCYQKLRLIEAAKKQYAIDHGATNGTQLTWDDLCYYITDLTNRCFCPSAPPSSRSLTNYTMNPIGVPPVCNVVGAKGGHVLK